MEKIKKALARKGKGKWTLEGYDTFSEEAYLLDGSFSSEEAAQKAAKARIEELEKTQPTESTGGQDGIQDRVYIIRPDGSKYRFLDRP